jgi:hypothetical protein
MTLLDVDKIETCLGSHTRGAGVVIDQASQFVIRDDGIARIDAASGASIGNGAWVQKRISLNAQGAGPGVTA